MCSPKAGLSRGFTLLEVLITMVIFAMLFAVLMTGWYQAMRAQAALAENSARLVQQQQLSTLLRRTVEEALAPPPNRGQPFQGDAQGFKLESTTSLDPSLRAAPATLALRFESSSGTRRLRLEDALGHASDYPWRFTRAELAYVGADGRSHERWPPDSTMLNPVSDESTRLPSLVQVTLRLEGDDRDTVVLAAPRASRWDLPEPTPPLSGLTQPP